MHYPRIRVIESKRITPNNRIKLFTIAHGDAQNPLPFLSAGDLRRYV